MSVLTLVVAAAALLLAAVALLLVGLFVGMKLRGRAALAPAPRSPSIPPPTPPASPAAPRIDGSAAEVARLRLKLINCLGGNEGAMSRTMAFERKKFPHLSEAELIKKMLYDIQRGH